MFSLKIIIAVWICATLCLLMIGVLTRRSKYIALGVGSYVIGTVLLLLVGLMLKSIGGT